MIKRNNLVYNVHSVNEFVGDKNINQPIQVVVKDVTLINDYNLKIFYNHGVTKNIELVNNSIKNFEYVSEGNKIIIETNNNDKFEIEIPMVISHKDLTDKNAETDFQHVTLEQKASLHTHNNKEYLDGYSPTLFATALQGEKADSALQSLPPNTVIDVDYSALKDKVNGIEENANNYQHPFRHPTYMLEGVNALVGTTDKYLNEKGDFTKPVNAHEVLEGKNNETDYQHVDTITTKEVLVDDDKVTIYDSATGKVVLTDKSNVGFHTHENKEYLDNYNPALFATALQGEKADSALQSMPPGTIVDVDYPALKDKVNGIEPNANNYTHPVKHPTSILEGVNAETGSTGKYLNEKGEFVAIQGINTHSGLTAKNDEVAYQHVDTTTPKPTLVNDDKVVIFDSVTGKVVLTDKSNVGGGGSTDIISTNATNNTGTIVIDTTPNWQRVDISEGGSTLILDYVNGILPTKNREYLLIIINTSNSIKTLTLPAVSFVKNGITYNFTNTEVSVSIEAGKSIEVNVIFFFIDATTCNVRTQITQFI